MNNLISPIIKFINSIGNSSSVDFIFLSETKCMFPFWNPFSVNLATKGVQGLISTTTVMVFLFVVVGVVLK